MYFFIADEHYWHGKIIIYSNRPFQNVVEMNEAIINNSNKIVGPNDVTIHAGDFTLLKPRDHDKIQEIIDRLNGRHVFLKGSHDYWIPRKRSMQIWEKQINGEYVVVCHYAMHTWARSHYNSWHLYGHSHKDLELSGKRHCISVENTNYQPISFERVSEIMKEKSDNPNFLRKEDRRI